MIKYENMDNFKRREHIVEITLQQGEYKGTIKQKISGNCFGLDILHVFDPDDISIDEVFFENNCNLKIVEGDEGYWYTCTLKNDASEETECEDEARDLKNLIVKIEIVECTIVKDEVAPKLKLSESFDGDIEWNKAHNKSDFWSGGDVQL